MTITPEQRQQYLARQERKIKAAQTKHESWRRNYWANTYYGDKAGVRDATRQYMATSTEVDKLIQEWHQINDLYSGWLPPDDEPIDMDHPICEFCDRDATQRICQDQDTYLCEPCANAFESGMETILIEIATDEQAHELRNIGPYDLAQETS